MHVYNKYKLLSSVHFQWHLIFYAIKLFLKKLPSFGFFENFIFWMLYFDSSLFYANLQLRFVKFSCYFKGATRIKLGSFIVCHSQLFVVIISTFYLLEKNWEKTTIFKIITCRIHPNPNSHQIELLISFHFISCILFIF